MSGLHYDVDAGCPRAGLHTASGPAGYLQWHEWAKRMSRTHRQRKCPGCGLYKIWEPKDARGSA